LRTFSHLPTFCPLTSVVIHTIVLVVVLVLVLGSYSKHPNHELPFFEDEHEHEEEDETDVTQLSMNFRFSWIIMVSTIMPKPVAIIFKPNIDCDFPPRPTSPACEKQI
jgi:hypothetical protein